MKTIIAVFLIIFALDSTTIRSVKSFSARSLFSTVSISGEQKASRVRLYNFDGKGWDNDSFLDSLGGNKEAQKRAVDEYKDFKEAQEAFVQRNEERMKTKAGRQFMKERADAMMRLDMVDKEDRHSSNPRDKQPLMGFEQKLIIPLDYDDGNDDDEEDESNYENLTP